MPSCLVCGAPLRVSLTHPKKAGVGLALTCPVEPRHFRGFCNYEPFVRQILARIAPALAPEKGGGEPSLVFPTKNRPDRPPTNPAKPRR